MVYSKHKISKILFLASYLCGGVSLSSPKEKKDIYYKSYNAAEVITTRDPRLASPVRKPVGQFITNTLNSLAHNQDYQNEMTAISNELNENIDDRKARMMFGSFEEKKVSKDRTTRVKTSMTSSASRYTQNALNDALGINHLVANGINFDVDFASPFPEEGAPKAAIYDPVTYGLIVDEISPSFDHFLTADNFGNISESALLMAPKSRVKYKIGPKRPQSNHISGSKVSLPSEPHAHENAETSFFKVPSAKFKGKMKPKSTGIAGDGVSLPHMVTSITQEEGLYRFDYHTKEDFKKDTTRHYFNIPLVGNMHMESELDEKTKPLRSSAKGILVEDGAPSLDIHYFHNDENYQSEMNIHQESYHINLKAITSSPVHNTGPKYEIGFSTDF